MGVWPKQKCQNIFNRLWQNVSNSQALHHENNLKYKFILLFKKIIIKKLEVFIVRYTINIVQLLTRTIPLKKTWLI